MKILLYGINFAPEPTGIGKYTGEMAAWLAAAGNEVRVIAAPPYYPAWSIAATTTAARSFVSAADSVIDCAVVTISVVPVTTRPAMLPTFTSKLLAIPSRAVFWSLAACIASWMSTNDPQARRALRCESRITPPVARNQR